MVIGFLELSNWTGISVGAVHWYARLIIDQPYENIEILHPLSEKEIRKLNIEEGYTSHTKGDLTHKFDTEAEALAFGKQTFKSKYTGVLFRGDAACRSPWIKAIVYPTAFSSLIERMNKIADKFIALNGYEGSHQTVVERLDHKWGKLYETLRQRCKNAT